MMFELEQLHCSQESVLVYKTRRDKVNWQHIGRKRSKSLPVTQALQIQFTEFGRKVRMVLSEWFIAIICASALFYHQITMQQEVASQKQTTATHDIATVSDQWLLLWSTAQPGSVHYPPLSLIGPYCSGGS